MTWTAQGAIVLAGASKTTGTSITSGAQTGYLPTTGDVIIATVGCDNTQTTDGDSTTVTSVTDTKGNTYVRLKEYTNGNGTAGTGATVAIWACLGVLFTWDSATTITANHASLDARVTRAMAFTPSNGNGGTQDATTANDVGDASDPASFSLTPSGGSQPYLWLYALNAEGPNTDADTVDSGNGWTRQYINGTSGGVGTANVYCALAYQLTTASSKTVDWTHTAADYAQVMVALTENAAASKVPTGSPLLMRRMGRPHKGPPVLAKQFYQWSTAITTTVDIDTAGALTFTGQSVAFTETAGVSTAGQITFTGQTVAFRNTLDVGTAGAVLFTGGTVSFVIDVPHPPATFPQLIRLMRHRGPPILAHQRFDSYTGAGTVDVSTAGQILFTGQTIGLSQAQAVTAGQITFTGQPVGAVQALPLTAGAITFTGQAVAFKQTQNVTAGQITFTGQTVTTVVAVIVPVTTPGQITFTGQAVAFTNTAGVTAGAILFAGQSVGATVAVSVTAGQITFTGQTVAFRQSQAVTAGAILFTGQGVSATRIVPVTAGALTFAGQAIAFRTLIGLTAGQITFTGQTVGAVASSSQATVDVSTPGRIAFTGSPIGALAYAALIETFQGAKDGGPAQSLQILSVAGSLPGGPATSLTLVSVDGVTAGGAPAGTVKTLTVQGQTAGGAAAGSVLTESKQGT